MQNAGKDMQEMSEICVCDRCADELECEELSYVESGTWEDAGLCSECYTYVVVEEHDE